jgi:HD superfamily phosphodiesterase
MTSSRTKYFSSFALSHMPEMRLLRLGGILGRGNKEWRNVAEHCLTEAVAADVLAEHLSADRSTLVSAALLHDWYKRQEVEAMKVSGAKSGHVVTLEEDKRVLGERGVNERVISVAHSNIPETADHRELAARSLEEKILHFVDVITSGSDFLSVDERFDVLELKPRNVEFSESFRERFGKSLYELQRELGHIEQEEFEKKLGLSSGSLITFIKNKIEERRNVA